MAGGSHTYVAGDVLTAAQMNDYVDKQVIAQVTSGTRPTGVEGRHIDESDTERQYRYDGTNWRLRSPVFTSSSRTSGNITCNGTAAANLDTGLDLTLPAVAGDRCEIGISGIWNSEAVAIHLDAMTVTGSNYTGGAAVSSTQFNQGCWFGVTSAVSALGGSVYYTVVSGDISGGNVVFRFRYATEAATNKLLLGASTTPIKCFAVNHGPMA